MKKMVTVVLGSILILAQVSTVAAAVGPVIQYEGCERVTAAVAIDNDTFVAASRDDNVLRVYARTGPTAPLLSFDLSDFLGVDPGRPSAVQGATRVGDRVYWITSHGRDEEGRIRPERYRFFATRIESREGQVTIVPVGKPAASLVLRLVDRHTMRTLRLDKATRLELELSENERRRLAPSRDGLNIEALCASRNSEILMAFRNPRPVRVTTGTPHALIVPLDNAAEVIERGEDPIFGEGMLWDLEGQGIVSLEYSVFHRAYFVLAGPADEDSSCVLYRWSGMKADPPESVEPFSADEQDFLPETIVPFDDSDQLLLLGGGVVRTRIRAEASHESEANSPGVGFRGRWFRP